MAKRLEPYEKLEAAKRAQEGQRQGGKTAGRGRKKPDSDSSRQTFPRAMQNEQERTNARTAKAAGMSRPSLEKVKVVAEAAKQEPERFGPGRQKDS